MVWPHLKILCHGEDSSAGDSRGNKKERKTEDGMASRNGYKWSLEIPCRQRKTGKAVVPRRPPRLRD